MEGDDLIRGGEGRDILVDSIGSNTIYGDIGYDRINVVDDETSPDTADTVFRGFGNDAIFADGGDVITGGQGTDRFQLLTDPDGDPVIITDYEVGDTFLLRNPDGRLVISELISTEVAENG
jgi:Ca2+-binding RTX toxin-like protein